MKRANEKPIEAKLQKGVTRLGGLCLKLPAVYFTGIPDRLCLLPGGRLYFVETKSSGKDLSPRQAYVKRLLEGLGFKVWKVDSEAALAECLRSFGPLKPISGGRALSHEEAKELIELETAQNEIRRRDSVDDLSRKDLRRLKELRTLNY